MKEKRFSFEFGYIKDNLTGKVYTTKKEIVNLLNDLNDRADHIVESFLETSEDVDYYAQKGLWKK